MTRCPSCGWIETEVRERLRRNLAELSEEDVNRMAFCLGMSKQTRDVALLCDDRLKAVQGDALANWVESGL